MANDLTEHYRLEAIIRSDAIEHVKYRTEASARPSKHTERWRATREIGRGGFAVVRSEVEESSGRVRALKFIDKRQLPAVLDYRRELLALATIAKHSHVFVDFQGWFESNEHVYIAMELFELGDLGLYLHGQGALGLSEAQAIDISRQLLDGLEILHKYHFTHRDIKPQNIFVASVSPSIWVKIGDFGVSKRISIDDATALRTCVYTPSYAAPEVVRQDGKEYSRAVDMWSLGCVIHEVLTRKVPFPGVFELTQYVLGLIPFPSHLNECGVSVPGIYFIRKLLAVNPDDRPSAERATQDPWLCATEAIHDQPTSSLSKDVDREDFYKAPAMPDRHNDQETQYPSIISLQKAPASSKGPTGSENSGSGFAQSRTDPTMGATSGVAGVTADAPSNRTSVIMPHTSTNEPSRRNPSTVRAPPTVAPSVTEAILPIARRRDSSSILQLKGEHFFHSSIPLHQAVSLNWHNPYGATPFDDTEVQQIINEGKVDVDFRSPRFGLTPLDIAAYCGYTHSAKMILASNPAAVHSRDEFGIGPIERAKQNGHDSLARLFQELRDQSDPPSQVGESAEPSYPEKFPLHAAALLNDVEAITRILERKAIDVNGLDSLGCTPLHIAASVGAEEAARKLIVDGRASTKLRHSWGLTAKEEAQKQGHHKVAQAIKEVAQEQFFPRMVEKSLGIFGVKF